VKQHGIAAVLTKGMTIYTIAVTQIIDHNWRLIKIFKTSLVNAHFIPG
jgi:hypothetical protein